MTDKPRLAQLHDSGGTEGDVPTLRSGLWVPEAPPAGGGSGSSAAGIDDLTTFNNIYGSGFTSLDQEFARAGNPTSLPTGWSWVNQGTSTYVEQGGAGIITPQSGAESLRLITRPLTGAPSTWTAVAKFGLAWSNSNWHRAAIVLRNASSGNFVQHGLVQSGGWHTNRWASPTAFTAAIGEDVNTKFPSPMYVKIVKNSATSYDFYVSTDGLSWYKWVSAHNPSLTIDEIGFLAGAPGADRAASFHWMRIR